MDFEVDLYELIYQSSKLFSIPIPKEIKLEVNEDDNIVFNYKEKNNEMIIYYSYIPDKPLYSFLEFLKGYFLIYSLDENSSLSSREKIKILKSSKIKAYIMVKELEGKYEKDEKYLEIIKGISEEDVNSVFKEYMLDFK